MLYARVCVLAFPLHHSVTTTPIYLIINALWTAASSFWNLYSSHALNCYFRERLLYCLCCCLWYLCCLMA